MGQLRGRWIQGRLWLRVTDFSFLVTTPSFSLYSLLHITFLSVEAYDPVSVIRMLFGIAKTPIFLSFKFAQPISSVQIEHTPSPFFVPLQRQIDDIIESKKGYMSAKEIETIVDSVPLSLPCLPCMHHFKLLHHHFEMRPMAPSLSPRSSSKSMDNETQTVYKS